MAPGLSRRPSSRARCAGASSGASSSHYFDQRVKASLLGGTSVLSSGRVTTRARSRRIGTSSSPSDGGQVRIDWHDEQTHVFGTTTLVASLASDDAEPIRCLACPSSFHPPAVEAGTLSVFGQGGSVDPDVQVATMRRASLAGEPRRLTRAAHSANILGVRGGWNRLSSAGRSSRTPSDHRQAHRLDRLTR